MWTNKYIGIPYKANGRDINGADCWGLTRLVYSEQFNIELPSFSSEYGITDDERILELIAQYREGWEQQDAPVEGSLVLFRILGADTHIGIAISATHFLHIREGSDSAIESFESVKWARRISGYFKYSPKSTGITLNAVPHPLRTERITKVIAPGTTLYEVYASLNEEYKISSELKKHVNIMVNGVVIPEILWDTTVLKDTDTIEYRAVPGKDAFRMILTLAVLYVAIVYAGPAAAEYFGATAGSAVGTYTGVQTFAYAAAVMATNVAGGALINAIAPIRPPEAPGSPASSTAMLMVNGGSNSFTPYAAIPVVLGKVRITPPLGASTYVSYGADSTAETVTSSDAYLNMLLAWGYGPLHVDLTTLRIGTADINNYTDVKHATISYETTPTTAELTAFSALYSQDVHQDYKGLNLSFPGYTSVEDGVWTTEDIDSQDYIENGSGSYSFTAPNFERLGDIKYKVVADDAIWTTQVFPLQYNPTTNAIVPIDKLTISIQYPEGLRTVYLTGDKAGQTRSADGTLSYQLRYNTGTTNSPIWGDWGVTVSIGQIGDIPFSGTFGAPNTNPVNDGFTTVTSIRLPRNDLAFGIRVRRIAENAGDFPIDATEKTYHNYSTTTLIAFTTYRNIDNVISDPLNSKIAKTAIHIKATDQISGQIEGISAVVQTITPVWINTATNLPGTVAAPGTSWVSKATSNPAALFRYILQHPGNPQRVLDVDLSSKVNLTQLQYWSEYCASKGFEFNTVLATQRSVSEVLRDICAAGRASPAYIDGKWTVVIDEPKANIVQHFSTHNSWGFEGSKLLPKYPDGLKIQFYDEENDYQQAETIVYVANKNASNAELFESIQLPGVTKASSVEDHARWHFAQIKLRPEIYTLNTDVEYLVCNRGDRVKVTHDIPMWGLGSGRIKNRITASVFDIDEEVPVKTGTRYTVRIRSGTGTSTEAELKTQFTPTSYSVVFSASANITTATLDISNSTDKHPIIVGDSILINIANVDLSYLNTTAIITKITDTSISYILPSNHVTVTSTTLTGTNTVSLTDDYYSKIQLKTDVTSDNATAGDLFLFGEYQTESQDLIVLSIEPMSGPSKSAKLTMVDYGVSTGLNIFTNYTTVTNATVFNSNMTNPPLLLIGSIGDAIPTITTTGIRSDESVMELVSPGVFRYKLKIPYTNPVDIPAIVNSVEAQLCIKTDINNIGGISETTLVNNGAITFTDVQLDYLYKVRLRYLGKDGSTGSWTDWVYPAGIVGKSNPPSNVSNFTSTISEGGIALKWTHCPEIDYASTIIKMGLVINDVIPPYSTATTVFEGAVDSWTYVRPVGAVYKFWAIHKDTSGNESTTPTLLTVNYTSLVLASISSELSNPTPLVPSDTTGSNPVLTLTGTTIKVYEGGTLLKYDAIGTANSRWKITSIVNSTGIVAAGIPATATAIDYATMPILSSFANTTSGTVTYTIDGKTSLGTAFTLTKVQYFTKVKPGATLYTWIAYATNATGTTGFTTGAWADQTYIGLATNKTTSTESSTPSDYTWSLIKGTDGLPGDPGADGTTLYTWIAYATNATGTTGFTTGAWTNQTYIGLANNKTSATESSTPGDYTWSLIKGTDGTTLYTWIAYATNATGTTGFTTGAWTNQTYIGLANNRTSATESSTPSDYTWSLIKGDAGVPGSPGDDGVTLYTWIAYATNATGTTGFTTGAWTDQTYIGLATNKTSATESSTPSEYTWSLIKGDAGVAGSSGAQTFRAYIKTAGSTTAPATNPPAATTDGEVPSGWSLTPVTLAVGDAQWQSDGKIAAGQAGVTGNTVWGAAYLSYFKVGSLSAISADLGTITGGSITIAPAGVTPTISGTTMTGSGAIITAAGSFALGSSTSNITGSSDGITINTPQFTVVSGAATFKGTIDSTASFSAFTSSITGGTIAYNTSYTASNYTLGSRTITISGGKSPYTYSWSLVYMAIPNNASIILTNVNTATVVAKAAFSAGGDAEAVATCTVTDSNGRTTLSSFNIIISSLA